MEFIVGVFVQGAGSLLVLAGFALVQGGAVDAKSRLYLILNVAGSAVLAFDAWHGGQWGFLLLEGVWAIVSTISLVRVFAARRATAQPGATIPPA